MKCLLFLLLGWSTATMALHPPLLSADQAFQLKEVSQPDEQSLRLDFSTSPGYYLYRERFNFRVMDPPSVRLGNPQFPSTNLFKIYPDGKKMQVYAGHFTIQIPTLFLDPKAQQLSLEVRYQGCSDSDICYPEETRIAQLPLSPGSSAKIVSVTATQPALTQAESFEHADHRAWFMTLLAFFGMGLLLSLTPCVLPMLPILSGLLLGQKKTTPMRSFGLSLSYVLAMAVTYAIAGLIAGVLGSSLQAMFQVPWVIIGFSAVLIVMALALFGWFNVELPQSLRSTMAKLSRYQKHGSYWGAAVMGALSTLILSPCATPALAGAMLYIAKEGQASFGAITLFIMALGMGVPLLIIGAFGAKFLPKVGAWMNECKHVLAFVLLAVAISTLSRLLPGFATMLMWSAFFIGLAVSLRVFQSTSSTGQLCKKLLGILCLIYGVLLIVGTLLLQTNPLRPLPIFAQNTAPLHFYTIHSIEEWQLQRTAAKTQHQPICLDFYASWCIACAEMDELTFQDPTVKRMLASFRLIRADISDNSPANRELQQSLGVIAPPTLLFFDAQGHEIKHSRTIGYIDATKLADLLTVILGKSQNPQLK